MNAWSPFAQLSAATRCASSLLSGACFLCCGKCLGFLEVFVCNMSRLQRTP
ncbi:hypothetical protein OH77DRAFT_1474292, partial [Trametes cingulata]